MGWPSPSSSPEFLDHDGHKGSLSDVGNHTGSRWLEAAGSALLSAQWEIYGSLQFYLERPGLEIRFKHSGSPWVPFTWICLSLLLCQICCIVSHSVCRLFSEPYGNKLRGLWHLFLNSLVYVHKNEGCSWQSRATVVKIRKADFDIRLLYIFIKFLQLSQELLCFPISCSDHTFRIDDVLKDKMN